MVREVKLLLRVIFISTYTAMVKGACADLGHTHIHTCKDQNSLQREKGQLEIT